ncbi:hypothetical protein PAEH1_03925 [Paenalcaligenes hominis]|uniref:UPF0225 protein PAEH1_03925 n=1 Tax=Paenalcaligenes hominis TaxID=643674 RepID=A0A1U9JYR1_9BURK|nr:YchJ family metal-binding protein [Paenalcaligenes hominis]AQS50930.1 hypothetical protein PAEH1_03925 [Paenalcaligenes hominis]
MSLQCPCQSALLYDHCCARWHTGDFYLQAPSAELLMRSRYSAFVLDKLDYLLATWHPSTRPQSLEANPPNLKWLGLEIRNHCTADSQHHYVEFVARNRLAGRATRLHEISHFIHENGQWFYVDGEFIERP